MVVGPNQQLKLKENNRKVEISNVSDWTFAVLPRASNVWSGDESCRLKDAQSSSPRPGNGDIFHKSIHNNKCLNSKTYKCLNSKNPPFMWNIFQTKDVAYNLRTNLQLPSTNTLSYGNDSLSFRGALLWNTLSDSIKGLTTSTSFKRSIKE